MTASPATVFLNGNTLARGYFSGIGTDLTELNGANLQTGTVTADKLAGDISPVYAGGFKNALIGGDFSTNPWQRGTTFALTGGTQYTADRWASASSTGTGHRTISRQTGIGLVGFSAALRVQRTTGATDLDHYSINQVIESSNVIPLQGQTVTLSFWVRGGSSWVGANLNYSILSGTGVDQGLAAALAGTWTGATSLVPSSAYTLTASWTRVSFAVTLPSNGSELLVQVAVPWETPGTADGNQYFDITGVQLEPGSQATSFERRPLSQELELCHRYCRATGAGLAGLVDSPVNVVFAMSMAEPMRIAPAISLLSSPSVRFEGGDHSSVAATVNFSTVSASGGPIGVIGFTGLVQGQAVMERFGVNFILLNAEL